MVIKNKIIKYFYIFYFFDNKIKIYMYFFNKNNLHFKTMGSNCFLRIAGDTIRIEWKKAVKKKKKTSTITL